MGGQPSIEQQTKTKLVGLPSYSLWEVCQHSSVDDCWIVLKDVVYDVSRYVTKHPGGRHILMEVAGTDATRDFSVAGHSAGAQELTLDFVIGSVRAERAEETEQRLVWEAKRAEDRLTTPVDSSSSSAPVRPERTTPLPSATSASTASTTSVQPSSTWSDGAIPKVTVLFGSQTGNSEAFANRIGAAIRTAAQAKCAVNVVSMETYEPEDLINERHVIFVISTYQDGTPPGRAQFFCKWLEEAVTDWRVPADYFNKIRYAVFGLGNSLYEDHYNVVGRRIDRWMTKRAGLSFCARGEADESVSRPDQSNAEQDFAKWLKEILIPRLTLSLQGNLPLEPVKPAAAKVAAKKAPGSAASGATESKTPVIPSVAITAAGAAAAAAVKREAKVNEDDFEYDDGEAEEAAAQKAIDAEGEESASGEKIVDLEDLGSMINNKPKKESKSAAGEDEEMEEKKEAPRAMLTDQLRAALSKQGYKLIGSHSGVKLCRWTKAMLRGRGGCYKHTFYGIQSYQCMEMTPSLACANKCVFCWRHHTNPVGKEWRWLVDNPRMLIDQAIENHRKMVKEMRGVPGVKPERLEDAANIRHCALSLVGEPIMYPHINEYVRMLHGEGISSFLVTNAQFPDRIAQLEPVTQLYVSIDASTQDSLKAIDRPLFKDFWQRFLSCLEALRHKQIRTVYRLTLVKGFNMSEIAEYAQLVAIGRPTFIEIKGVTFCGELNASTMTMKNVPFHEEVRQFCKELIKYLGGNYELACEHVHSCCILISDTSLKINGKWHTHIDYPKFLALADKFYKTGEMFSAVDYAAETPEWAVYGADEGGFSPNEMRFRRKTKGNANNASDANDDDDNGIDEKKADTKVAATAANGSSVSSSEDAPAVTGSGSANANGGRGEKGAGKGRVVKRLPQPPTAATSPLPSEATPTSDEATAAATTSSTA